MKSFKDTLVDIFLDSSIVAFGVHRPLLTIKTAFLIRLDLSVLNCVQFFYYIYPTLYAETL